MPTGYREWHELEERHRAFWLSAPVDRPLIGVMVHAYQDTELVARAVGAGELLPERVDARPILAEYDRIAAAREAIGDDMIGVAEALLGIPWLEAICGCRVMVADGKSLWPAPPEGEVGELSFSPDNPWFRALRRVLHDVVAHVNGRYAVGLSHLRGPTDILAALLGTSALFAAFYDAPERIERLAQQAAAIWLAVAQAQTVAVPAYRGGYGVRQFGLWAPARAVWLQDDTSSMMSAAHYRRFFLEPMHTMSVFPYGVLHLHIPSLHVAEMLAEVPNVRAINIYFDSPQVSLQEAMPVLRWLQARGTSLILAKDVYRGFSWAEYEEILDSLSPRGLSVHLAADSIAQGREVMAAVREKAKRQRGKEA